MKSVKSFYALFVDVVHLRAARIELACGNESRYRALQRKQNYREEKTREQTRGRKFEGGSVSVMRVTHVSLCVFVFVCT